MTRLVLKKTAFEIWDNAVLLFALNLGLAAALFSIWLLLQPLAARGGMGLFAAAVVLVAAPLFGQMVVSVLADTAVRQLPALPLPVLRRIPVVMLLIVPAILFLMALVVGIARLASASDGGTAVAGWITAGWLTIVLLGLFAFLPALVTAKEGEPGAIVLGLARLMLGNPIFAAVIVLVSVPILVLTLGLLPGPAGLALLHLNAARFCLKRYEPPYAARRAISWDVVLAEERLRLQRRSIRSVLQPWKA